jgi:hypothetical protein
MIGCGAGSLTPAQGFDLAQCAGRTIPGVIGDAENLAQAGTDTATRVIGSLLAAGSEVGKLWACYAAAKAKSSLVGSSSHALTLSAPPQDNTTTTQSERWSAVVAGLKTARYVR